MLKSRIIASFLLYICLSGCLYGQAVSSLEKHLLASGMVNVHTLDKSILVDLKYSTSDNFTGIVLYDSLSHAYLHADAVQKLVKAQQLLKVQHPGYSLLVYDAARPLSVQRKMFNTVKGTPKAAYVASPQKKGLHNFGMAVDLTICDEKGIPLDMGTPFDFLGSAANTNKEEYLIKQGVLTRKQVDNRKLLRGIMLQAGFRSIYTEWWHFNAVTLREAVMKYKVIE